MDGVRRMIACAKMSHHAAYVALCGMMGLRSSEALNVSRSHFDFHRSTLTVRGKGDVQRIVPVSPEAWDVLVQSVFDGWQEPTIVGLRDRFARKLVSDLGVKAKLSRHVASHDLRATFATAVFDKTQDMRVVQMLLGHASIETTQIYVNRTDETLRAAVIL